MKNSKPLYLALIISNPIILFLLFKSILVSILVPLACFFYFYIGFFKINNNKWIFIYSFNLLAILSIFIHLEAIIRFGFPELVIENLYQPKNGYYIHKANIEKQLSDKEYSIDFNTNVQGYRLSSLLDPYKEVKEVDWLIIGDSYAQAAQVKYDEVFSSLLYRDFPDKIILNAGVSGWGLPEEYEYYKSMGQGYNPELVILQLCTFNDFMNVKDRKMSLIDYLIHKSDFIRLLLFNIRYKQPGELPLGRWTEPFYPTEKENIDYNIFFKQSSKQKQKDIETFFEYIIKFNELVKKNGSRLIITLIPSKEQIYFNDLNEVITNFEITPNQLDMAKPHRLLKSITDSLGIDYLYLFDAYAEAEKKVFFSYDEHLNKYGHKITAKAIKEYISDSKKNDLRFMSESLSGDRYPTYSFDGEKIIFQSIKQGGMELFISDKDMKNAERVTFNNIDENHPLISPKGYMICTEGDQMQNMTKIAFINLDTKERQYLPTGSNVFGAIPSFSPNWNEIAIAEWYVKSNGSFSDPEIVIYNTETFESIHKIQNSKENWRPIYNPKGGSITYISKINGQFDIIVYDLLEKTETNITNTDYDEWDPNYSPNGEKIIYSANVDGNWDLFQLDLISRNKVRITQSKGNEWDASYSKDGKKIIYAGEFGFINGISEITLEK